MTKLEWTERKQVSKKNADKYHYVRFVEKKKLTRKLRHIRDELVKAVSNKEETAELEKQLALVQDDMMYVQRFPLDEKYISLFPTSPLSEEALKLQQEIKDKIKSRKSNRDALDARLAAKKIGSKTVTDEFFDSGKKPAPAPPKRRAATPGKPRPLTKPVSASRSEARPPARPVRALIAPVNNSKQDTRNHPSWAAKADPKQKGTLAGFSGQRMTFDEDD